MKEGVDSKDPLLLFYGKFPMMNKYPKEYSKAYR